MKLNDGRFFRVSLPASLSGLKDQNVGVCGNKVICGLHYYLFKKAVLIKDCNCINSWNNFLQKFFACYHIYGNFLRTVHFIAVMIKMLIADINTNFNTKHQIITFLRNYFLYVSGVSRREKMYFSSQTFTRILVIVSKFLVQKTQQETIYVTCALGSEN